MAGLMLPPSVTFGMSSFTGSMLAPTQRARLLAKYVTTSGEMTIQDLAENAQTSVEAIVVLLPLMPHVTIDAADRSALRDPKRRASITLRSSQNTSTAATSQASPPQAAAEAAAVAATSR